MNTTGKIEIGSGTIFRVILILAGFAFLFYIRDIIMILLGAFIIASAIEPIARSLRKYRIPRAMSVVIVYLLVLFVISASIVLIAPALIEQTISLANSLPATWNNVEAKLGLDTLISDDAFIPDLQGSLRQFADSLARAGSNIFEQTRDVFSGLLSLIFVLILAFYLVIEENAAKKLFRWVVPSRHMTYVEMVLDRVQRKLGHWVIAQLSLGIIIGVVVGVGLWIIGVDHALALGLIAGVLEIIPVIGPIIAGVIGSVVALSQSLFLGLGVALFYVIVQQAENHLLIPAIMRRATGLNPLVTLVAVLVGAQLAGVVGVILSVPVATILSILMSDFFKTATADDELAG